MNYFEFYGLPVKFNIDLGELKKTYYQYSKDFHPDFHSEASETTQEEVLKKSALNNEAYKTLKDFDKRLKYLLELKNVIQPSDKDEIPQDFLIEMMDINERIMEVQFDFNEEEYNKLLKTVEDFENNLTQSVSGILDKDEFNSEELPIIKNFYYKKKYLKRLKENIEKVKK